MTLEQLFSRQATQRKAAAQHFRDGQELLKKAKVDDLPDEAQSLIERVESLVEAIEARLNDPHQNVVRLSDYEPP